MLPGLVVSEWASVRSGDYFHTIRRTLKACVLATAVARNDSSRRSWRHSMSFADEPLEQESAEAFDGARSQVAEKVKLPAIFLIIVGVLNVLGALYGIEEGTRALLMKEKIAKEMDKAFEDQKLKSTQLSKQQQQQQEEMLTTIQ